MFGLFNGVVRPYSQLPVFWHYWMYQVNPSTWWIAGVLSKTLANVPVICTVDETAQFTPPAGQTCLSYAGAFASTAGGYFLDETSTTLCQYCPYSTGNDYLKTLNIGPGDGWRDCGIFCVYVLSNYALVYFFIYTIRIRGWSFGFGWLFGLLGKVGSAVTKPFKTMSGKKEEGGEA
jgi:ATP-binding cassette subfamily G (WHITE) protein 2 (SNQ2)